METYDFSAERLAFKQEVEKKPVKTLRYLWHVSKSNVNVAINGLEKGKRFGAVFAHNVIVQNFCDLYPWCIHGIDEFVAGFTENTGWEFLLYTFWRIDTRIAGVDWYIDPNMKADGFNQKNFVCCFNEIPIYALKAFKLNRKKFLKNKDGVWVNRKNGVACVRNFVDFDSLEPCHELNDFIRMKSKIELINKANYEDYVRKNGSSEGY